MQDFHSLLQSKITVKEADPGIFSVFDETENQNSYDGLFGDFYDIVACNPVYNRIMWGYSSKDFEKILKDTLDKGEGPVLDAGCGSLGFTYKFYASYRKRPVVFLDQSIKLLRKTHRRITDKNGNLPENFFILQGDAFALPFRKDSFSTGISMNLLHVLSDVKPFLSAIAEMVRPGGNLLFTTLIINDRFGDSVIKKWEEAGEVYARSENDLHKIFNEMGYSTQIETRGNMAFIQAKKER